MCLHNGVYWLCHCVWVAFTVRLALATRPEHSVSPLERFGRRHHRCHLLWKCAHLAPPPIPFRQTHKSKGFVLCWRLGLARLSSVMQGSQRRSLFHLLSFKHQVGNKPLKQMSKLTSGLVKADTTYDFLKPQNRARMMELCARTHTPFPNYKNNFKKCSTLFQIPPSYLHPLLPTGHFNLQICCNVSGDASKYMLRIFCFTLATWKPSLLSDQRSDRNMI